ncbi:DNA recombination protein RmuC [Phytobacter sp. V91]|uniref:DNA recombination protein RmuC n=1 Tax=Phytobacter sp. V91 TaxID=3369425 RepID=UPI003F5F95C7
MTDMTVTVIAAAIAALLGGALGWFLTKQTFAQRAAALEHETERAEDELMASKKLLREQEGKAEALRNEKHQLDIDTSVLRQQINDLKGRGAELLQRLSKAEEQLTDERRLSAQLDHDYTELKTTLAQREQHFREQFANLDETKKSLSREFENIANKIFEEKGKTFTTTSKTSLDDMLKPFREQIDGFQKRVNEVHDAAIRGNADLNAEIKKVLEIGLQMSAEATSLASALKGDSQQRGAWGEAQLRRTLEMSGLVEAEHYEVQSAFRDEEGKRKQTDYLIRLPDNKHIIIDSKVTLNAWDRVCSAPTPEEQLRAMDEHIMAVRRHIDDLASKDYTRLAGIRSPSFVLMFMPIESAYIEVLKTNKGLFEYGYRKGIVLVSHTTLIPILRTVSNLWMIERSNSEAREISERAGEIFNNVCLLADRLSKLGGTLSTASNQYNATVTALVGNQGLYGKVERFGKLSEKVNKELPKLELSHRDFEHERLTLIAEALDEPEENTVQTPVDASRQG